VFGRTTKSIVRTEKVALPVGGHKAVNFKVPISQCQIDAYQSGYDLKRECSVKASIVS